LKEYEKGKENNDLRKRKGCKEIDNEIRFEVA